MPKDLLPMINNVGTVNPISGPAIYQGQGCFIHSSIIIIIKSVSLKFAKFYNKTCFSFITIWFLRFTMLVYINRYNILPYNFNIMANNPVFRITLLFHTHCWLFLKSFGLAGHGFNLFLIHL